MSETQCWTTHLKAELRTPLSMSLGLVQALAEALEVGTERIAYGRASSNRNLAGSIVLALTEITDNPWQARHQALVVAGTAFRAVEVS